MYSSVKWLSRVWTRTILCLPLLPFGERGGKAQGPSEETWESLCVDDAPPLSNWGKANMIRPNLKDDQCLPPQRRSTVLHVLLPALLRGRPTQFDDGIKLFRQKHETAKQFLFFIENNSKKSLMPKQKSMLFVKPFKNSAACSASKMKMKV